MDSTLLCQAAVDRVQGSSRFVSHTPMSAVKLFDRAAIVVVEFDGFVNWTMSRK